MVITNRANYPISFIKKKLKLFCSTFKARVISFEFNHPIQHIHAIIESRGFIDYSKAHRLFGKGLYVYFRPLWNLKDLDDVIEYILQNIDEAFEAVSTYYDSHVSGYVSVPTPVKHEPPEWVKEKIRKSIEKEKEQKRARELYKRTRENVKDELKKLASSLTRLARYSDELGLDAYETVKPFLNRLKQITRAITRGNTDVFRVFNDLRELNASVDNMFDNLDKIREDVDHAVPDGIRVYEFDLSEEGDEYGRGGGY